MSYSEAVLYHVHDPMCSWCWGFRRSWDTLRESLPATVTVINVVGGLAPDSEEPMPLEQQQAVAGYWSEVSKRAGAEFNLDFWKTCKPRRSTYPACRAVLAASRQNTEEMMIDAIQHAYYLRAMNPSDNSTLIALAAELELDVQRFSNDLVSLETEDELVRNFSLRRKLGVHSFPSLVLAKGDILSPIDVDYESHLPMLEAICGALI
jgi:putative protein-disulfide isomerase